LLITCLAVMGALPRTMGHDGNVSSVPGYVAARASIGQGQGAGTRQSIVPPVSAPTCCGCGSWLDPPSVSHNLIFNTAKPLDDITQPTTCTKSQQKNLNWN